MPPSPSLAPFPWLDVIIILLLVVLNGMFAMCELAIVSSRRARLRGMARSGRRGAQVALDLLADPGRFLSTVQIGITLIAVLSGAFSGASLGAPVAQRIAFLGLSPETAETLGFTIVIILTTYASLVIGELVPKQIALRSPEPIAAIVAPAMRWMSWIMTPFAWLLDRSSGLVFRLLRMSRESEDQVTAEDLQLVVAEAATAGVLEESERQLISSVVRLADRPVREVMTPRTEVAWIDVDGDQETIRQKLVEASHNRIPVAEGSVDKLIGVVQARDVVGCLIADKLIDLRALMKPAPIVPDQLDAMDAMTVLRDSEVPMAFVHDEYGHFEGLDPRQSAHRVDRQIPDLGRFRHRSASGRARRRQLVGVRFAVGGRNGRYALLQASRGSRLCNRGRLRLVDPEAYSGGRRTLHLSRLALRSRRYGRPQDRQAFRFGDQARQKRVEG